MNSPYQPNASVGWVTPEFLRNRPQFPDDELLKFSGKNVAFSEDGTRILAAGDGYDELFAELDRLGIPAGAVVCEFVPDPDAGSL